MKTRKKTQNFQGKMQVLTEVVEPNEDNVQRPTETTEEWEAAPGGVFAPVRPDTSIAGKGPGKAPKGAHQRVHPYRRPSPKEPSTVAGAPACAGIGAVVESMGDRLEKVTLGGGGRPASPSESNVEMAWSTRNHC